MTDHSLGIGTRTQSMTILSYLHSEMYLQKKFPDQTEFQSWIVHYQVEVCAKAKNLALVLQWIKRSKEPARWRTSSIPNQLRENISLIMKNWIWWWRQNWNGLRYCLFDLRNYRAWSRDKTRGRKKSYTAEKILQRETSGSCSRRDACSFLHRHAAGDREDNVEWSGDTREILTWSKHTLQYRKCRNRLTGKAWTV